KELGIHCIIGEKNVEDFPFLTDTKGAILYHHENADGTGPFGKTESETPIFAQIIHFSDTLDAVNNLSDMDDEKYKQVLTYLDNNSGILFPRRYVEIFKSYFKKEQLQECSEKPINDLLGEIIPSRLINYDTKQIISMTNIFAKIIDYKSSFTRVHSIGVAEKAAIMGEFYNYDDDTINKLYIAGALHDIGKLAVDNSILEKPDKLTNDEYKLIQIHAFYTYDILSNIEGFSDIARWASYHHEKLNGKGYPFGKTEKELDKNDRLLACLDIYQALTENRPYKVGMSHEKTMAVLFDMADDKLIDKEIVNDINFVFGREKGNKSWRGIWTEKYLSQVE
ncbi:MAG: HD domain-containing phosphohydrolase, partial [Oscillospiraceae bacterium]